jgi:hypothetical protein
MRGFHDRRDSLLMFKPLKILRAKADGLASWKPVEGQLELGGVPRRRY